MIIDTMQLDSLRARMPEHFTPILDAVEQHGVACLFVERMQSPWSMKLEEPLITVIADDFPEEHGGSLGPEAYHVPSLIGAMREAEAAIIIAGAADIAHYAAAASVAVLLRKNAVVIETQPQWQDAWTQLALHCGCARLLIVTPAPMGDLVIGRVPGAKLH